MATHVLIFKTSIQTVLDRTRLIDKMYLHSSEIKFATVDLDDEDFILRVESTTRNEHFILNLLRSEGHLVSFMSAFRKDLMDETIPDLTK